MKKKAISRVLTAIAVAVNAVPAAAQIPPGYYDNLRGKKGAELKNAVHETIKDANVLDYGRGNGHTWEGFYSTDRTADNSVIDRYSNDTRYFGKKGSAVSGMNIEHSFPKSWWGGYENQAYKDLYNLMPSEQKINSSKSNYPMGKVNNATTDNGCTKVGTGSNGYKLWEPADRWKGDFARAYMYMATAYQDLTWQGAQALQILQQDDYPTLQPWAYRLYVGWAKADAPDATETARNEAVSRIQGNRNPFVDFPNLMEYIWGDSTGYAFDPETTLRTSAYTPSADTPLPGTVYAATFTQGDGGCTVSSVSVPSRGFSVWRLDSKYGWKATAYANNRNNAADASVITPELDLTDYSTATLTFSHAANYLASPESALSVEVICDGEATTLNGIDWPRGNSWTFKESGSVSLNAFAGKKIRIAFRYTSTEQEAGTWEIKSMAVSGDKLQSNIDAAATEPCGFDPSRPYDAYTIGGMKATTPTRNGIIIIRQGGNTWKVPARK